MHSYMQTNPTSRDTLEQQIHVEEMFMESNAKYEVVVAPRRPPPHLSAPLLESPSLHQVQQRVLDIGGLGTFFAMGVFQGKP